MMKVGRRIGGNLVTVTPEDGLELAFQLMVANRIRHLPVVREGAVVGIVSDRDLKGALILTRPGESGRDVFFIPPGVKVGEVMTADPVVVTPDTDVEEAARIMYQKRIGALPVVESGRPVGIITEADILGIFIEIMGVLESSSRIDVETDGDPSSLNRVAETIRDAGGSVISVAMSSPESGRSRVYYFRLASTDTGPIAAALERAGFTVRQALN